MSAVIFGSSVIGTPFVRMTTMGRLELNTAGGWAYSSSAAIDSSRKRMDTRHFMVMTFCSKILKKRRTSTLMHPWGLILHIAESRE
jgi:hypothetical protein